MLNRLGKRSKIGFGSGVLLLVIGYLVKSPIGMDEALSAILIICGLSLILWGLLNLRNNKIQR